MRKDLSKILDDCITQILNGESIDDVLAAYPDVSEQIRPLLNTAQRISSAPIIKPSQEFIKTSEMHLKRQICQESIHTGDTFKWKLVPRRLTGILQEMWQSLISRRAVAVTAAVTLSLVLILCLGQFVFFKPAQITGSTCFLSILSGSVSIQNSETDTVEAGYDGMTLTAGTMITTDQDSHVLLTFFDGSTIKLEPNTTLEIQQLDSGDEESAIIVLKQWLGRTWSRVIKMIDTGSKYEIETPSATALVRGTLFSTEVTETGSTTVSTTQGLVSVAAREHEVFVPPNQQTNVEQGSEPSQAVSSPAAVNQLIITIEGAVAGSVNDPTGSSTGVLPSGLEFNQIQGSTSSSPDDNTQIITIAEPVPGDYTVTLRYLGDTTAGYHIQGISGGETRFEYVGSLGTADNGGRLLYFDLQFEEGEITSSGITINQLGNETPENVIDVNPKSYKKETPPGQSKDGDGQTTPPGQTEDDNEQTTPPGQAKDNGEQTTPPGQAKDDDGQTTPPGQAKDDDGQTTPPGQTKDDTSEQNPPGQTRDDSEQNIPPDQAKDNNAQTTPPGQVKEDSEQNIPPGQMRDDSEQTTPPGQAKKEDDEKENNKYNTSKRKHTRDD